MPPAEPSCTASYLAIACLDLRIALVEARGWLRRNWVQRNWTGHWLAVRFADRYAWR
jgi:hypothetical protein